MKKIISILLCFALLFSFAAFAYTGIRTFTVPKNVSAIAQGAFMGSPYLESITFSANSKLESISAYMFDGCSSLNDLKNI